MHKIFRVQIKNLRMKREQCISSWCELSRWLKLNSFAFFLHQSDISDLFCSPLNKSLFQELWKGHVRLYFSCWLYVIVYFINFMWLLKLWPPCNSYLHIFPRLRAHDILENLIFICLILCVYYASYIHFIHVNSKDDKYWFLYITDTYIGAYI